MTEKEIKILSLNCWGLKYVSKNRVERVQGISQYLAKTTYDIIALQEIWVYADFERVRDSVSHRLPHSKFFYSGALGSGLAFLSRYPITAATIHPYSLNGEPTDVKAGDWFVGKAAATIVVSCPILGQVQIFNTHLFAKGGEGGPEYNRAHRLINAWEFAKLARQAAEAGKYVIAAGDFNSIPTTLPMTVIRDHASLQDSCVVAHPPEPTLLASSPEDAIAKFGITADSPINSYSAGKYIDSDTAIYGGKRLDYVLYRQPRTENKSIPMLRCKDCRVVMTELVPGCDFSFSDHFGLESTLEIVTFDGKGVDGPATELSAITIDKIVSALTMCYRFSKERARKELIMFGLCVLAVLVLIVGSAWIPYAWINPILLLFTAVASWWGTTMLYEGFLFGNWETNALMNTIEELEIHKATLHGDI